MTKEKRLACLYAFADLLGIHQNELMAIQHMGNNVFKALVPNRDVVNDLRLRWGDRMTLLDQGFCFLVSIDLSHEIGVST